MKKTTGILSRNNQFALACHSRCPSFPRKRESRQASEMTERKIKIILALAFIFILSACEKKSEEDEQNNNEKVTRYVLMGQLGKAWSQSAGSMIYYSASGAVDSTVTLPVNLTQSMWFGDNCIILLIVTTLSCDPDHLFLAC